MMDLRRQQLVPLPSSLSSSSHGRLAGGGIEDALLLPDSGRGERRRTEDSEGEEDQDRFPSLLMRGFHRGRDAFPGASPLHQKLVSLLLSVSRWLGREETFF